MSDILQDIYRSTLKLLEPTTENDVFAVIVEEANALVGADYGSVFLEKHGKLQRVYTSVPAASQLIPRKNGFTYQSFTRRKAIVFSRKIGKKNHPEIAKTPVKLIIIIPLCSQTESLGILTLQSEKMHHFSQKKLDTLKLFGSVAMMRIRNVQLYVEAQKALHTRDLFISMASHELRTPLTTVLGYIQLLDTQLKTSGHVERAWVSTIQSETLRLKHLVNELLRLDQIDSGQLRYSWEICSISEIVSQALNDLQFIYPNHQFLLTTTVREGALSVVGDKEKLLQVIINLCTNAAKFSPRKRPIEISLKKNGKDVVVAVQDHGVGISRNELPHIFEAFHTTNDSKYKGIGLGLFLTKAIVEKHRGQITIRSRQHRGTKVEISLPESAVNV